MLIAFAGRPGVGKTSIARLLAQRLRAAYLRIDTIEQALLAENALSEIGPLGYLLGYRLAADQLGLGLPVVADCVNPLPCTRAAWLALAAQRDTGCLFVEVVCSDASEHRRRIESRAADIAGHVLPDWAAVLSMPYAPMQEERLVIDSARQTPQQAVTTILARLAGA